MSSITFIDNILLIIIGMIIGAFIAILTVSNSFQHKIKCYEELIDRVDIDNPDYIDNVLCETEEWYNLYK